MSIGVRSAGVGDVDRAAPLFDAYRQFYGQPADPARARDWLVQRLSRGEATLLLAERDGRAVGFTLLYPMWSSVSAGPVLVLNDLYVDASARRLGVAQSLLQAAAEHGRRHGALRLMLETANDNAAAQALYPRAGWTADSTQWFHLPLGHG
jgi:ribosomal protein S18 acetylase RimI-like enzyme